jgi:hypothetical protein
MDKGTDHEKDRARSKKKEMGEKEMKRILVTGVAMSGADIITGHLLSAYPRSTLKGGGDGVIADHIIYSKMPRLAEMAKRADLVLIPIRHPKVVAKLWRNVGLELDPDFVSAWRGLEKFFPDAIFLPMDSDDFNSRVADVDVENATSSEFWLLSEKQSREMALRPWDIEYADLGEDAEKVRALTEEMAPLLADVYGVGELKPPAKKETPAPKNSWEHQCLIAKEVVITDRGAICRHCGAEE